MNEFARALWKRSLDSLDSARALAEEHPNSAASRSYYAAFQALSALFILRGQEFKKHSAIRAALHRDLVQAGLLSSEIADKYDLLMDSREMGDYGDIEGITVEGARASVQLAAQFVAAVEQACSELGGI